jgi:hypothetical protein
LLGKDGKYIKNPPGALKVQEIYSCVRKQPGKQKNISDRGTRTHDLQIHLPRADL